MPVSINIKIVKVPAFMRGAFLVAPELEAGLETIGTRLERRGKGAGERRNAVNRQRGLLMQRISYERTHFPRRTGRAKTDKMRSIFKGMSPRVVKSIVAKITARWAA